MARKVKWEEIKISLSGAIVTAFMMLIGGIGIGANWHELRAWAAPFLGFKCPSLQAQVNWTNELNEVYNALLVSYNGEIEKEAVIAGAKKGIAASLKDPYTIFMTQKESSEYQKSLHGDVGAGIGVEMGMRDGLVKVLRTLPDNPARAVGVLAGDIIYKADGEDIHNLSVEEVAQKLRGAAGSKVVLTVMRNNEEKSFEIVRAKINNVSAYVEYRDDIAIITVSRFDTDTGNLVREFANKFGERGVRKVILDLRGNGGGFVSSAVELLSLWIDGEPVMVQKSKGMRDEVLRTKPQMAILGGMPTTVLVNRTTASAAEIVVGALKDYKKARLVGEKSFGKGVMQEIKELSNGEVLKVTIADWYTPHGNSINKTGIEPDEKVERSFEDINADRDPQLEAAVKGFTVQ